MAKKIFPVCFGLAITLISIKPTFASSTTYYFSPTFEKVKETGEITKYYPLPGGATVVKKGNTANYLYSDHLASTRLVTSNQGENTAEIDYYPYGKTFNATSLNLPSSRLYTSQIMDNSTDLYFYNARYYNPTTGAFISADSGQSSNRYAYVAGNPINLTDPTGNEGEEYDRMWHSIKNLLVSGYRRKYPNNYTVSNPAAQNYQAISFTTNSDEGYSRLFTLATAVIDQKIKLYSDYFSPEINRLQLINTTVHDFFPYSQLYSKQSDPNNIWNDFWWAYLFESKKDVGSKIQNDLLICFDIALIEQNIARSYGYNLESLSLDSSRGMHAVNEYEGLIIDPTFEYMDEKNDYLAYYGFQVSPGDYKTTYGLNQLSWGPDWGHQVNRRNFQSPSWGSDWGNKVNRRNLNKPIWGSVWNDRKNRN